MPHVTVDDVQVWLDKEKLEIPENDALVEDQTFADIVLSRVSQVYEVNTWIDASTTPALVRRIISALIAANRYNKIYSEEDDAGNRYANKIEARAYDLVNMIADGTVGLYDVTLLPIQSTNNPLFYPDDMTGSSIIYDANGFIRGLEGSADIKFSMSDTF